MFSFFTHIDVLFESLAEDVTYTPGGGGAASSVRAIPKNPDEVSDLFDSRITSETMIFDVLKSEVAQPAEGDLIRRADGTSYFVQGDPQSKDSDRLIWTLNTRPA